MHRVFCAAVLLIATNAAAQECPTRGSTTSPGSLPDSPISLDEVSGLVASRSNTGVLWVIEDSGANPQVHAITPAGRFLATYTLSGATNTDWEDIARGPGPVEGQSYLYISDTGDNDRERSEVVLYRVAEPAVSASQAYLSSTLSGVETFRLRYPGTKYDCETLLVDPLTGDRFLVTRDREDSGTTRVFRALDTQVSGTLATMAQVASFASPLQVKAGDVTADGRFIAVRSHDLDDESGTVYEWQRPAGGTLSDAFATTPCTLAAPAENQGESLGYDVDDAALLFASEGDEEPIRRLARTRPLSASELQVY